MQKLREECGVFGVYARESREVAATTYYGLFALQHRGQESCGIAVCNDGVIAAHKDLGLVEDVFTPEALTRLGPGHMAVGHVRYGTTGATDRNNAQPIVVNHCKGSLALAHTAIWSIPWTSRGAGARRLYFPHHLRYGSHLLCHHQRTPVRAFH
mgnify:CR=1 FL=1